MLMLLQFDKYLLSKSSMTNDEQLKKMYRRQAILLVNLKTSHMKASGVSQEETVEVQGGEGLARSAETAGRGCDQEGDGTGRLSGRTVVRLRVLSGEKKAARH
eukprot:447158-Hanusia_phi.AAC.6